jgi:hypothetical protein
MHINRLCLWALLCWDAITPHRGSGRKVVMMVQAAEPWHFLLAIYAINSIR